MWKKPGIRTARRPTPEAWTSSTPSEPHDLDGLARRAADGDRAAFRALVEASHAPIYRLARRTLGGAAEAEDAVQETFARAWSALRRGARPDATLGWLLGIARHVALDLVRARRPSSGSPIDARDLAALLADPRPGPRELVESAELSAAVRRVVEALPDRHRVILLLREVDGLSYDALAAALGCPLGTVESRLFRARAALARKLDKLLAR